MKHEQLEFEFPSIPSLLSADELFEVVSERLIRTYEENRLWERKSPGVSSRSLSEYLSMWANTPPQGGIIAVGVENDGEITGCNHLSAGKISDLERTGVVYCPDASVVSKHIVVTDKHGTKNFVLLFRIKYHKSRVVKTTSGKAYWRVGSSKERMTEQQVRELQIDKGEVEFELELTNYKYPGDFDLNLVKLFIQKYRENRGLDNGISDAELLERRHLGEIRGGTFVPNVACVLLFAKDPGRRFAGCRIRFLRFEGELEGTGEKFNPIKDLMIEGPIPHQIVEIESVLSSQLRDFTRMGPDNLFYTAPEYPKTAWYEAVVNACVHRSYSLRNMNIFVRMFDDRLEIESPGPFPPLVTPETIYDTHHPRNPNLMDTMFYLDFCKMNREGARRMRDSMRKSELPTPEFLQQESGYSLVTVTLRNNIKQRKMWIDADATAVLGTAIANTLNTHQLRVVNFIAEHGNISVSQVQRLTGKTWPASKKLLDKLVERGLLKHRRKPAVERDTAARYFLDNPNEQSAESD